ncbi:MAG: FixH family protein [Polyangiaceae bacterium]
MRRLWSMGLVGCLAACGVEDPAADDGIVVSASGRYELSAAFSPDPPQVGANTWTLDLRTRAGVPVVDAALTAEPWMPVHGHGVPVVPKVVAEGEGSYRVENLRFTMPGTWEVRVELSTDEDKDQLVVRSDVQ